MWENQVDTANRSKEEIYLSAVVGCLQMLKSGTTAVIDHFPEQGFGLDDVETVVKAFEDCGMRAVVALRIFDGEYSDIVPPPDRMTGELRAALATGNTLKPRPIAGEPRSRARGDRAIRPHRRPHPRFPGAVQSGALLRRAARRLPGHGGEPRHRRALPSARRRARRPSSRRAPMAAPWSSTWSGSARSARRWSCAHCNWVSEPEIAIMGRLGAVAVFNPESNLKIGSGMPPIPALLARRRAVRARHRRGEHQRQPDPAGRDAARRDPASRRRAGPAALGDGRRRDRDGDHAAAPRRCSSRTSAGSRPARRRTSCFRSRRRRGGCR